MILRLLLNDLKRDAKRPWTMLLFAILPFCMALLIGGIFAGPGKSGLTPTIHVAVLDRDQDLLTGMLRSIPSQGDASRSLRLHFVDEFAEGMKLVERGKASALVVFPTNMTESLLEGRTNTIDLYENPAEQILPKIVRQGTSLVALGLSSAAEVLGEPLRDFRSVISTNEFPADATVAGLATDSLRTLRGLRTYMFPALVQFETIAASAYRPSGTNASPEKGHP
jgi:hypothetical protein